MQIEKERGSVYADGSQWNRLKAYIESLRPSKVFVIADENTLEHCYPLLQKNLNLNQRATLLQISSGEEHKTIESCMKVWELLSNNGADRKSLILNLGGGVVTDLGGFVACTYQRGIEFVNIPTSLLAMVDASVGGKTGVDLGPLKNQIGVIRNPKMVVIDAEFLQTLPTPHFRSGLAEMLKHGLIHSKAYLEAVISMDAGDPKQLLDLIWESIQIKDQIISEDPFENGLRKTLNYGHTLGHAIESYCLQHANRKTLLHGEAIGIGLILANYLSTQISEKDNDLLKRADEHIVDLYGKHKFDDAEIDKIIQLLIHDKKNSHGEVRFVLLEGIGTARLNCQVSNEQIKKAFDYYSKF